MTERLNFRQIQLQQIVLLTERKKKSSTKHDLKTQDHTHLTNNHRKLDSEKLHQKGQFEYEIRAEFGHYLKGLLEDGIREEGINPRISEASGLPFRWWWSHQITATVISSREFWTAWSQEIRCGNGRVEEDEARHALVVTAAALWSAVEATGSAFPILSVSTIA